MIALAFLMASTLVAHHAVALASDLPPRPPSGPAAISCDLRPIAKAAVEGTTQLAPGVNARFALTRTISMQRLGSEASRYVEFLEDNKLIFEPNAVNALIQGATAVLRSQAGESCQFSISTFRGSASMSTPPTFLVESDGKARKCTRFDLPCGQETKCELRWNFQKCDTWTKYCEHRQVSDIGNWRTTTSGRLLLLSDSSRQSVIISATRDDTQTDTGGSGDVGRILESVGITRLLASIDTSLRTEVDLSKLPNTLNVTAIALPADVVATPILQDANWSQFEGVDPAQYSPIGISYRMKLSLKEKTACKLASCMRVHDAPADYLACASGP